jgi:type IV secretion system protein VirD4
MPAAGPLPSYWGRPDREPEPVIGSRAPDAFTVGRLVHKDQGIAEKLRYGGDQHLLLFGPNGKGKGTASLMVNLLQMSGSSIVVVDPKGELAAVTAPFRRTLGPVVVLNPFGVLTNIPGFEDLASCGFNPFATLDPGLPSFNAEAALIAEALIDPGETRDPHWPLSGRALIAALVMHTVIEAKRAGRMPTMARMRELLCQASEGRHAGNDFNGVGLPQLAEEMMRSKIVGLKNKAAQFFDWNREIQSIASTARIQTEPFDDSEIQNDLSVNGFDFRWLKVRPVTVYLILPPDQMKRHAKWLRLIITSAIRSVLRPRMPGEPKVLFMLDEFFALGQLEIISTVWSLVRGYGIQMLPVLQDLNQLKKLYPDMWETFIGSAGVMMSFAPNDMTTAGWLSQRAGETTRRTVSTSFSENSGYSGGVASGPSGGSSSNSGWQSGSSSSINSNETKAALITPHRFIGLRPYFMAVTLDGVSNMFPVYAPPYFHVRQLIARARDNPYRYRGG